MSNTLTKKNIFSDHVITFIELRNSLTSFFSTQQLSHINTIPTYVLVRYNKRKRKEKKIGPPYRIYITKVIFIQCEYFKMEYV